MLDVVLFCVCLVVGTYAFKWLSTSTRGLRYVFYVVLPYPYMLVLHMSVLFLVGLSAMMGIMAALMRVPFVKHPSVVFYNASSSFLSSILIMYYIFVHNRDWVDKLFPHPHNDRLFNFDVRTGYSDEEDEDDDEEKEEAFAETKTFLDRVHFHELSTIMMVSDYMIAGTILYLWFT